MGGNTTIIQGGNANLFDVLGLLITGLRDVLVTFLNNLLSAINLLLPIAGMLIDAATQVLTGLEAIMAAAINQLGQIVLIVQAIIQAASVDPQSIPGAPNCAGLATGTADWYCWGFYILDNTIFSGPAAILLPLVMAAAALNFMLWSFGEFRRTMAEV
ncbi:MAG: hypothetical protein BWY85_01917 [Firmicutes bacterium ADurb.Bin506]|nr:MAG: hypothetical protein BWY85_01917 [Firmicutes bacterium ADurb.Bin506]